VIELDDSSHQQRKRQKRDAFLVGLCHAVSLPLVRVSAQRGYSVQELRAQVLPVLGVRDEDLASVPEAAAAGAPAEQPVRVEPELTAAESPEASQPVSDGEAPACPKCSAPMVRRRAKVGTNAGQEFWGCSAFPKCRSKIPMNS
jgi:hypothetical protein